MKEVLPLERPSYLPPKQARERKRQGHLPVETEINLKGAACMSRLTIG